MDYYIYPALLFRLRSPAKQKVLFENTARAITDAPKEIITRHIGNCLKTDKAYGDELTETLEIPI
jgi:catalase